MLQRFRSFAQTTTYLGVVVIIAIWCGVLLLTTAEHRRAYESGARQGANLAHVFKEYISRVIGGADSVLLTLRDAYEHDPVNFDIARPFRRDTAHHTEIAQYGVVN